MPIGSSQVSFLFKLKRLSLYLASVKTLKVSSAPQNAIKLTKDYLLILTEK